MMEISALFSLTTANQVVYLTGDPRGLHGHDVPIAAVVQARMQARVHGVSERV
jgi:hypothetical protein